MTTFISPPMTVWIWMLFSFWPRVFDLLSSSLIPRPLSLSLDFSRAPFEKCLFIYFSIHPWLGEEEEEEDELLFETFWSFWGIEREREIRARPVVLLYEAVVVNSQQNRTRRRPARRMGMEWYATWKKKRVGWMASVIRQCLSAVSWVWAPCNGRRYVRRGRWIRCCLSSKGIAKEKNQKNQKQEEDNKLMP